MNFIDAALAKQNALSDDDFLQAMAGIYKEPDVWDIWDAYPPYIQDVIYIIDYDTVLQMEGLAGVLESGTPEKYAKIHHALLRSGALDEARILCEAEQLDRESDHYYEQIANLQNQTALYGDYASFWNLIRSYIGKNRIPSP